MITANKVDDEITSHLKQLSSAQKQILLVVLKTMAEQNKGAENDSAANDFAEKMPGKKAKQV